MELVHDDQFAVFVRRDGSHAARPDYSEHFLARFSSYEEARQMQRQLQKASRKCVIRYIGPAGGGD
jgi:hypothetical protein